MQDILISEKSLHYKYGFILWGEYSIRKQLY